MSLRKSLNDLWKWATKPAPADKAFKCAKCGAWTIYQSPAKNICRKCYKELKENY